MRNRLISLLVMPLVFLVAACNLQPDKPKPQTLEEALAACGEGCKVIVFVVGMLDEDLQPVGEDEGFEGTYTLDGLQGDADGNPKQITVVDITDNVETVTPYIYDYPIPSTHAEIVSPTHLQVSLEILAMVPAGYTLQCKVQQMGSAVTIISEDSFENTAGIVPDAEGAMGMPMEGRVFCSWPGVPDLDDIT